MSTSAKAVRFDDDSMWVHLDDGRVIAVPLAWFPRLLTATPEQRAQFELSPVRHSLGSAGRGHFDRRTAHRNGRSVDRSIGRSVDQGNARLVTATPAHSANSATTISWSSRCGKPDTVTTPMQPTPFTTIGKPPPWLA